MQYISTRDQTISYALSQAIREGLAPDGGLFVPKHLPAIAMDSLSQDSSYASFCAQVLNPFFEGDPLASELSSFCENAFTFNAPLKPLNDNTSVLELFHGPTLSFKDFGARFLAQCLSSVAVTEKLTILVATSGDTGSAVASAFYQKANIDVIILFPEGQISTRQQHQITCWGENIKAYAIRGSFDDCQQLVKSAFSNTALRQKFNLCTANSINIGRLLPQIGYYAYTSYHFYRQHRIKPNFIVPSGNLGNINAAYWAKMMGFPIQTIVMANNANRVMVDYLESGDYQAQQSIQTLANAMDVGNPSNIERLQYLFNTFDTFSQNVLAYSVSDEMIQQAIQEAYKKYRYILCPHTATGYIARKQCGASPWIIAGTADPCKFETVIEPIIQEKIPVSPALTQMLDRKTHFETINRDLKSILK